MPSIYMKISGIKGNATAKHYEGWMELSALAYGINKHSPMKVGNMSDRSSSLPSFKELRIRKMLDAGSNGLFSKSLGDQAVPEVEIHLCDSANDHAYYKLILHNVLFTQYHTAAYEGMKPFETLTLNYTKLQQTYIQKDSAGKIQAPDQAGYDLATAQKL